MLGKEQTHPVLRANLQKIIIICKMAKFKRVVHKPVGDVMVDTVPQSLPYSMLTKSPGCIFINRQIRDMKSNIKCNYYEEREQAYFPKRSVK